MKTEEIIQHLTNFPTQKIQEYYWLNNKATATMLAHNDKRTSDGESTSARCRRNVGTANV